MINVKTFLSLKNIASTDELDFGEIGILNEQLYFRGFDDRVYKIRYNEDDTYYTDIYGIRLPITYPQNPAQLTDDKIERVLIKRLVDEDGNYIDTEFDGDDTEMKYIISWDEGRVVEDTISQNYHPFNKMEVIDARYNGSEATILPIFYKNKTLARTVNGNDYIYYLISERPFDDFYPVESHLNQDGYYSKEIYLESDWREFRLSFTEDNVVYYNPLYLETYGDKRLYDNDFYINANIWSDYLYYLYMIKTKSFFPFKNLVENYTPVYYTTTYSPLNAIEQECTEGTDYSYPMGNVCEVLRIKLKNASTLGLKNNLNVLVGVGLGTSSTAPNIRSLPGGQTYPDFPVFARAFVNQVEGTDDYEIVFRSHVYLYLSNIENYKPFIVFLSQIPYDYYDYSIDRNNYTDLDIPNGTLESPVRMKVDFIKNLFPVFYNADCVLEYDRSSITLEQQLKRTYNYNTPIFFSNNSNILYTDNEIENTFKKINMLKGDGASDPNPNRYVTCYFVNNLMLDYVRYNLNSLNLQKDRNNISKFQLDPRTLFLNLKKQNTISTSDDLNNMKIVGNLQGIVAARLGTYSICFVGTDENMAGTYSSQSNNYNGNDNPSTGIQGYCWNSLICISANSIARAQFEDNAVKIVSRRVAYSKDQ